MLRITIETDWNEQTEQAQDATYGLILADIDTDAQSREVGKMVAFTLSRHFGVSEQ